MYHKAKAIDEKVHGAEHPTVAATLSSSRQTSSRQSTQRRLTCTARLWLSMTRVHGLEHPDVAKTCCNIGAVYDEMGNHKKALEFYLNKAWTSPSKSTALNIRPRRGQHREQVCMPA